MRKIALMLITLIVIGIELLGGCTNQQQSVSTENINPTASISANPRTGTTPLTVYFTGIGSDSDGTVVSYYWNFGDGSTSTEQNPIHTFQSQETYIIILTVTDDKGATASNTFSITVEQNNKEIIIGTWENSKNQRITFYANGRAYWDYWGDTVYKFTDDNNLILEIYGDENNPNYQISCSIINENNIVINGKPYIRLN